MVIITNFSPPEDGILYHEPGCQMIIDDNNAGTGDLYVTENSVMWSSAMGSRSYTLSYRQISLHAVQRVPTPLIYMMLDYKLILPEHENQDIDDAEDDDYDPDCPPCTEIKFVPQNEQSLTPIYEALNTGQCLHPDPNDSDDDDDGEEFMAADDSEAHPDAAATQMEQLTIEHAANGNGAAHDDEGDDQFADA